MKISVHQNCLALAAVTLILFYTGPHDARAQDKAEQTVSAGFASVEFLQAMDILAKSGNAIVIKYDISLCEANTHLLDLKKIDIPATVTLSIHDQPMGKALQAVLNKAYTPLTYRRTGDVYTIIPDPTRKAAAHGSKAEELLVVGSQSFNFTNTSFDEAIDILFRTYRLRYAIEPDVPVIRQGVTVVIANARPDVALQALLSSVSTANTALIYRSENGKFVIAAKNGRATASESVPLSAPNDGWDLDLSEISLEAALDHMFRVKHENYIFAGALNGTHSVVVHRHFDSEEAAVVAVLRSAQPEPMRIYRKERNLVTLLTTDTWFPTNPLPVGVTCHCTDADFTVIAKGIFGAFHKNYRIENSLQHESITLSLGHVSFDEAYKSICKALPLNSAHIHDGIYDFGN